VDKYIFKPCTIDAAGNLSDEVDLVGYQLVGVVMPAAWTAADIAFQVDPGDGTFRKVYDRLGHYFKIDGPVASCIHMLRDTEAEATAADIPIVGAQVKLHSIDTSDETDEAQDAERTLYAIMVAL